MANREQSKVTLDPAGKYLTFINTISVEPEKAEDLLEALRSSTEEIFRQQPGFMSANLHLSADGKRVVNYAQWRSKEDYMRAAKRPEIQQHMQSAATLAIAFDPVDYVLRHSVTAC